jgi:hypothetical protein
LSEPPKHAECGQRGASKHLENDDRVTTQVDVQHFQNHRKIARSDIHVHTAIIGGSGAKPALILLEHVAGLLKNEW